MEAYVKKQVSIRIMTAFVLILDSKEGSVMVSSQMSSQMRTPSESFSGDWDGLSVPSSYSTNSAIHSFSGTVIGMSS